MDLTTDLVAYWDFQQNPNLFPVHEYIGGQHLAARSTPSNTAGIKGNGILISSTPSPQGLYRAFTSALSHQSQHFTFVMWFKPTQIAVGTSAMILSNGEYGFNIINSSGQYYFSAAVEDETLVIEDVPVVIGQWYMLSLGWDGERAVMAVNADHGDAEIQQSLTPNATGNFQMGNSGVSEFHKLDGVVDEAMLWRGRFLTIEELRYLYNDGAGREQAELAPQQECASIECCNPDLHAYRSESATDSEAGTNNDCMETGVTITPPSGSTLIFPSLVVLETNNPDAVIRYTLDSTDPDQFSAIYSTPIEVESAGTIVKARAYVGDCAPGPIMTASFQNPPFQIGFAYACDTPDKGGSWNVWAPNGTVDNHWQIAFTLTALTEIVRLEMYQLDAAGEWATGIAWSTDNPINPDGGDDFDVFPLLIFVGAVQQWAAYQSTLGSHAAAAYVWDLYGDRPFAASGYFRFDMILASGVKITQISAATCTAVLPPVTCPSPAQPTLTAKCDGAVDVTFTGPVGRDYRILYSDGGPWVIGAAGTIAASPTTTEISGLVAGGFYYVRVDIDYVDCGFQASIYNTVVTLRDPVVSISTNKTEVDPNESFTISWNSNYIGGAVCGGCLAGEVSLNQSIGCKPGNTSGSIAQSQATPGDYTYSITGCNTCGTEVASVLVTVRSPGTCGSTPNPVIIDDITSVFCDVLGGCACEVYGDEFPKWDGSIWQTIAGGCTYSTVGIGGCLGPDDALLWAHLTLTGGQFVLTIRNQNCISELLWQGTKLTGTNARGVYNRTGGCASGPATITIT